MLPDNIELSKGGREYCPVEVVLVPEMVIDHRIVDLCDLCDLARRSAIEPSSGKYRFGGRQDSRATIGIDSP